MNDSNLNLEKEFLVYLNDTFGKDFESTIQKPDEYCIGERVLYKLHQPEKVNRNSHEFDEENVKNMFHEITGENSGVSSIDIRPPVTTNNIEPRLIDLPDWDITFDIPLMKYFQSDKLLPHQEFQIKWLLGVFFGHSAKKLVYIDMLHHSVVGIFSIEYKIEMDLSVNSRKTAGYFRDYSYKLNSLCEEFERGGSNTEWIKLIQLNNNLMIKMRKK